MTHVPDLWVVSRGLSVVSWLTEYTRKHDAHVADIHLAIFIGKNPREKKNAAAKTAKAPTAA